MDNFDYYGHDMSWVYASLQQAILKATNIDLISYEKRETAEFILEVRRKEHIYWRNTIDQRYLLESGQQALAYIQHEAFREQEKYLGLLLDLYDWSTYFDG